MTRDDGDRAPTGGRLRAVEVAAAFPAFVAVGLSAVYVIGAALRTAQLRAANVGVGEALPLIPLEQLLSRGIEPALSAFFVVLFAFVTFALLYAFMVRRDDRRRAIWTPPGSLRGSPIGQRDRVVVLLIAVPGLIVACFAPPVGAAACWVIIIGLVLLLRQAMKWEDSRIPPKSLRVVLIGLPSVTFGLLIVSQILDRVIDPEPLPKVHIEKTSRVAIDGRLVAVANGMVYTAVPDRRLIGVPESEIRSLQITSPPPSRPKAVFEYLTGWSLPDVLKR